MCKENNSEWKDDISRWLKILDKQLLRLVGEQDPVKLDPAHTALIVVDMQYFDAHPDWGEGKTARELGVEYLFDEYYQQIDIIIPQIQKLLGAFRKKQMEVMHLTVSEVTNDSRDVGYKQLVRGLICPANSKEAQLLDEVKSEGDEIIIKKSSSGVFPVTNFDRLLKKYGNHQTRIHRYFYTAVVLRAL